MGIKVLVRVRPFEAQEAGVCLDAQERRSNANQAIAWIGADGRQTEYEFDRIFTENCSQHDVFEEVKHAVHFVLEGFNGTIMAYGQTSSGKTHTLFGDVNDPQHRGIVPRAAAALASCMAAHRGDCTFRMAISVLEVHNEKIRDLLVPSQDNLQVFKDDTHGVEVPGLHSELLDIEDTEAACLKFVTTAMSNRAVAATAMNEASSRSHCMVILGVTRTFHDGRTQYSKLCLVDLAGSERQKRTGAHGPTLLEGQNINKSLLVLGSVVNALSGSESNNGKTQMQKHVPYRDSKLTRLLQDCLGGTSNTCIVCCVASGTLNRSETLSTLRFGERARAIPSKPSANLIASMPPGFMEKLEQAQKELARLKERLQVRSSKHEFAVWVPIWVAQVAGVFLYFAMDHLCGGTSQ